MAHVWANSMACQPTDTYYIAGSNNSIRHIENRFSAYFISCFFNAVWALASGGFRIVFDTLVIISSSSNNSSRIITHQLARCSAAFSQLIALLSIYASLLNLCLLAFVSVGESFLYHSKILVFSLHRLQSVFCTPQLLPDFY